MMWGYGTYPGWPGWLMVIMMTAAMIAFWAVIVVGTVAALRAFTHTGREADTLSESAAEQVLATRFAHGELTEEQYRSQLSVLRQVHRVR
ncbi:SHOCT domain-containing protein [Gordonia neofelifaecis]|uniref:SHOCT domain-containing protein n=1 Tax=Gordonia neofelifaecis NRRL B-59395 TaxID=644548 RepID=F1YPP0_9ACTN|nr:hypothetical protein [Gordonia neofelifaecis]EGD53319.1 hypothetical protein SCNU_19487 [Gordonia neofelifaecis NRRL B-59395]